MLSPDDFGKWPSYCIARAKENSVDFIELNFQRKGHRLDFRQLMLFDF
jgi:hypothetical protein